MLRITAFAFSLLVALPAFAGGRATASARLTGASEVPSVNTPASGSFRATATDSALEFRMEYEGIASFTAVSHIHFGQKHTTGGLLVYLCNNTATGPAPRPCPQGSGVVEGTITAADVIGPTGQGVTAGDFAALLRAVFEDDAAYVNVHSATFPTGEIRGQLKGRGKVDKD